MDAPSMVQRTGDTFIVRSVVSGNQLFVDDVPTGGGSGHKPSSFVRDNNSADVSEDEDSNDLVINEDGDGQNEAASANSYQQNILNLQRTWLNQIRGNVPNLDAKEHDLKMLNEAALLMQSQLLQNNNNNSLMPNKNNEDTKDGGSDNLPQCKIKRNYTCPNCSYFTQNPRLFLTHLKEDHGEKLLIHECKLCVYASRHYQKLVRHMKMVHGQTVEQDGSHLAIRKRANNHSNHNNSVSLIKKAKNGDEISNSKQLLALMGALEEAGTAAAAVSCSNSSGSSEQTFASLDSATAQNLIAMGMMMTASTSPSTKKKIAIGNSHSSLASSLYSNANNNHHHNHQNTNLTTKTTTTNSSTKNNINNNNTAICKDKNNSTFCNNYNSNDDFMRLALRNNKNNSNNNISNDNSRIRNDYLEIDNNNNIDNDAIVENDNVVDDNNIDDNDIDDDDDDENHQIQDIQLQQQQLHHDSNTAHDRFSLKCGMCPFETPSRRLMVEHETHEHPQTKTFRCVKCNYVTHMKARFSKHVKYHSMPMTKCNLCDFRTPYKWNLDRHMKNHGGNGPFKCAACNFTADIKQSLTVHEMNHHVPAVGAASGMQPLGGQQRRRNKVGATDSVDNQESIDQKAAQLLNLASSMNLPEILQAAAVAGLLNDQKNDASQKKAPRPIPNLIPIQGQPPTSTPSNSALNLSSRGGDKSKTGSNTDLSANEDGDDNSNPSSHNNISIFKKKNESFFDKLKEKLVTNSANGSDNLVCPCNHVSKCLSELIIHQNNCQKFKQTLANSKIPSLSPTNLTINKNSTRCQFCRHRCKSSADLIAHMQRCSQATNSLTGIQLDSADSMSEMGNSDKLDDDNEDMDHDKSEPHPMENRIFVWNTMPEQSSQDSERTSPQDQFPAVNIKLERRSEEPEPILSGLPDQFKSASMSDFMDTPIKKSDHPPNTTLKKVFKCPHCSFWASTASRFHVHIVGHLNKKPFECSLCSYRSNWRWDITKHIRLKTIRDPSHKTARVLMNDETGRRNYTKYNKYISLMKVSDEDGNLKLMKSGEMTPNQEASLTSPHNTNIPRLQSSNNNSSNSNNANFLLMQSLKHFTDGASLSQNIQDLSVRSSLSDSNIDIEPIISNTTGIPHLLIQAENQMSTPETSILLGKLNSSDMNGENKKQTCYKCKKCQFKHPNRNVVLEHVNEHYRDAGVLAKAATSTPINSLPIEITPLFNNSGSNMNHNAANLLLPRGPAALSGILPAGFLPSLTNVTASAGGHYNTNLNIVTNSGNNNSANPGQHHNSNTNGGKHNSIANKTSGEHGEMDEASSGGTSGPPGWRSAAPYRCGHCHQVSNWKHVIQRHCRLKHNGNIKIELIGKEGRSAANKANTSNSVKANKNQAFHQPLQVAPAPPLNNPVTAAPSTSFLLSPSQVQNNPSDNQQNNTAEMMEVRQKFNSIINQFGQDPDKAKEDNANKKKNYQCGYCPYLTDNKSQFSYHKSLHKADRMEDLRCKYCNYTATKKHLLEQHMKIHQQKTNSDDVIVVESENHSVFPKATVQESSSSEGGDVQDLMIMQIDEDGQDNPVPLNHKENKENMVRIPEKRNRSSNEFFCPHCPFKDGSSDVVNDHKKFHSIITNKRLQYNCEFCDFTSNIEQLVKDHRKLHFAPLKDLHKVEFCTTYDKLKLFVTATTASMAATSSHSTSQDQKIYDEDEVDEETSWINQFRQKSTNGTSSNSSKNVISSSGNSKVLVNSIGPSRGSLKRNHTSNNETSGNKIILNI